MKITVEKLPDLDPNQYYDLPILSNSKLSFFWRELTNAFQPRAKPETLRFGQILHQEVYEPETHDLAASKEVLGSDYMKMIRMASAARMNPTVRSFLKHRNIIFEKPVYILLNGVPISVRPDALIPNLYGHDLKSTAATTLNAFIKSCRDYKYFRQMSLYRQATGVKNYYITGISKKEPYKTFSVDIDHFKDDLQEAEEELLELIRLYVERYPEYISNTLKLWKT